MMMPESEQSWICGVSTVRSTGGGYVAHAFRHKNRTFLGLAPVRDMFIIPGKNITLKVVESFWILFEHLLPSVL